MEREEEKEKEGEYQRERGMRKERVVEDRRGERGERLVLRLTTHLRHTEQSHNKAALQTPIRVNYNAM